MAINRFELIKAVLDDAVEKIARKRGITEDAALELMKKHLQAMSNAYFSGKQPLIAYEDPLLRAGYLFQHAVVNSHLCAEALRAALDVADELVDRIGEGSLSVCAFGGGPGTELMALASIFSELEADDSEEQIDIEFRLIDRVNEWSESLEMLKKKTKKELERKYGKKKNWPFNLETSFMNFDITKVKNYHNLVNIFESDIFIMNYVISEVIDDADELAKVIKLVASKSPQGAVFLVIDRNEEQVQERAQALLEDAGLQLLAAEESEGQLSNAEWAQRQALDDYIEFMDRRPRRKWKAFWQIAIKS